MYCLLECDAVWSGQNLPSPFQKKYIIGQSAVRKNRRMSYLLLERSVRHGGCPKMSLVSERSIAIIDWALVLKITYGAT